MIWQLGLDPSREGVRAHGDRRIWIQRCGAKGYAASNQARRSQIERPGPTPHARAAVLTRRRPISRRHGSGLTGVRQDRCSGGSGCRDCAGERGWTTANPSGQSVRRIGVELGLSTASGGDGTPGWCSGHQRVLHGTTSRAKGRGASGIAHRGPETSGDAAQRRLRRGLAVR
jgi:hypothetical protein